jgi:hypothetical protein
MKRTEPACALDEFEEWRPILCRDEKTMKTSEMMFVHRTITRIVRRPETASSRLMF